MGDHVENTERELMKTAKPRHVCQINLGGTRRCLVYMCLIYKTVNYLLLDVIK